MSVSSVSADDAWRERCARIRAQFAASGTTVSQWARERGFTPKLVFLVLEGSRRCMRGQSHEIAVALGLKPIVAPPGPIVRENADEPLLPIVAPMRTSNRIGVFDGRDQHANSGESRFYGAAR